MYRRTPGGFAVRSNQPAAVIEKESLSNEGSKMKRVAHGAVGIVAVMIAIILGTSTAQATPAAYTIDVQTCDIPDAGTDANVQLKLSGSVAASSWLLLDNPGDDRERGQTDRYIFTLSDLGPISKVGLFYDHSGPAPDWCLVKIVVAGPHGKTIHPFNGWLTMPTQVDIHAA